MENQPQGWPAIVVDYIQHRAQEKLEKLDKEIAKLKASANPADQASVEHKEQKRREEQEKFVPANWLDDAARRASWLQLVTHAPKFIHTDAKASGIYAVDSSYAVESGTVCSGSLAKPAIDVIGNAAALDVGKLLQLEYDGVALVTHIAEGNIDPLAPLAKTEQQAEQWLAGLKLAIESGALTSHKLTKQIYWPVENDSGGTEYHLLAPLFATSFQHEIYHAISDCNFSPAAKEAKEARRKGLHHPLPIVRFVDVAEQHFGGTKPQNVSQLNSQRYGKSYLLSSAGPEQWQSVEKPPLNEDSIFTRVFSRRAGKLGHQLRYYLERVFERDSTKAVRDERAMRIDEIVDVLFAYAAEVQQFPPGWSASLECHLPMEEQLLLDPQRRRLDPDFQREWDKKEWPNQVAERFSRWLNHYISGGSQKRSDKLFPGDTEATEWRTLVKHKINALGKDFRDFYIDDEEPVS